MKTVTSPFKALILALALTFTISGQAAVLINTNATWKWRPGTNEASAPVEAWRGTNFNDAAFINAPAPFWYDTGGDSSTLVGGTQITGMQNVYRCIFLRKTFVVTNLADISALRLSALVDDGFVAWINSTEVLRVNMPGAPGTAVTFTTAANNAPEPVPFTPYDLLSPLAYLVSGTNVLTVQVFQSVLGSSDLDFEASLESVLIETNPPTVISFNPEAGSITNLTEVTVTFSEPVSGVDAADLLVNGGGALIVTPLNSLTYRFTFLAQPPYGPVTVNWRTGHNITDQALTPNPFDATGPGATRSYTLLDNTRPSVASVSPAAGATVQTLNSISVLFSEPVTGVNAADLLINNNPAASVTPLSASQYTFTFSTPLTGVVQVTWAGAHGITDLATVPNPFAAVGWTYVLNPDAGEAQPYISEFMASNTRTLNDGTGLYPDWIEIYNPSSLTLNLAGWYLTDDAGNLNKWQFPATNLAGGGFLVVFASGLDRRIPGARLHTSFQLKSSGEYLALVKPDDVTIASEFRPEYPAQATDVSYGFAQFASGALYVAGTNGVYFTTPTPGAANLGGATTPGPVIENVQHSPNVPQDNEDLLVTTRIRPSFFAVASVTMRYRIMFSNELTTAMFDDGLHGDGVAGDGLYGATISANLSTNGQMIRYLIAATDVNANASRWPVFATTTNHAEYLGTIVTPTNVTSLLPIFQMFAAPGVLLTVPTPGNPPATGADSEAGGRVAIFYDGEFYDNVYMELRGNSSSIQGKRSHRLEFNREHKFRHLPGFPRVRKTSFMAEFMDPAYIRQHLSFWLLEQMGMPVPFFYPVRLQLNGQFFGLAFHSDVIGQEQVERMGYDPKGALYKAAGNVLISRFSYGNFQKLEPDGPPDYTDYNQLCNGIVETATLATRRAAVFDMMDVPEVINYLAGARWNGENDDVWTNMSLHRDTFGDQLWRIIPFDMNASWGQRYGGITPLDATLDTCKSHPLYGGSTIMSCEGGATYNRIYDVIIALPETRQMLLRRMRTVLDRWVLEPGVAPESRLLETHIREMTNSIWTEAVLDRAKWGYSTWQAANKPLGTAIPELFNEFINLRRIHFSVTHNITNVAKPIGITPASNAGIPITQPSNSTVLITQFEYNPASGNQQQEFLSITNPNPYALDISGWQLGGGARFTFKPGTVLPSNSVIYVTPSTLAFRQRTTGPRGGQGLFVVGPYDGQLSAWGETVTLADDTGRFVSAASFVGTPSDAQRYLRITEIMYHPSPLAGSAFADEEFEYLELKNISTSVALSLTGVRLTNGVDFSFTGSAVTSLAPGASVLVVKNLAAFQARYGSGLPVAGQFTGALDNSGETLRLEDAVGEKILEFAYNNSWYPITDGLGFSLVIVNEAADWSAWGERSQWRASGAFSGSPGLVDPAPPVLAPVLVNEARANSMLPDVDAIELFNSSTNPADISGWFLSDSLNTPKKYIIPPGTIMAPGSFLVFYETNSFGATNAYTANGANAFGLGASGDDVYLFSGNGTNLTGYAHGFSFGASPTNITHGRFEISTGPDIFVLQLSNTLGGPNSGPFIGPIAGPIVINEFSYDPNSPKTSFIELFNTSSNLTFDLSYWQLKGLSYTFPPPGSFIGPRAYLVLAADRSSFAAEYGAGISVFGTFSGNFSTNGETITLIQPGPTRAQDVIVDRVHYDNALPWSTNANGTGFGFQLIDPLQDNSRAGNWASSYFPGSYTPATNFPGGLVPGFTNYNLRFASVTGNMGTTPRLMIYLGEVGEAYIDDLYLANGNVAEAGTNLIVNGDLETPLLGAPALTNFFTSVGLYHTNSVIATTNAHSGTNSLRIISTNSSNIASTKILYKDIPGPTNGQVCTLSFWYRPTFNCTNLYARFQNSTIGSSTIPTAILTPLFALSSNAPPTFVPAITLPPASLRSPGAANTNAATLPPFPPLWLNEVQAENLTGPTNRAGQRTAWLELYNAGPNVITLTNLFLSGNYTNLTSWAFPAGATINPGEFKLIFADGQTGLSTLSELHTSFALTPGSGSLALSRFYNGQPQIIDYLNYNGLTPGRSYGSYLNGQSFDRQEFLIVTPRSANVIGFNTAPTLVTISRTNDTEVILTWQSFPGRNYRVEYIETVDAPGAPWTPIGDPLTATSDTLTFTDTMAPSAQRFYRIRQLEP